MWCVHGALSTLDMLGGLLEPHRAEVVTHLVIELQLAIHLTRHLLSDLASAGGAQAMLEPSPAFPQYSDLSAEGQNCPHAQDMWFGVSLTG